MDYIESHRTEILITKENVIKCLDQETYDITMIMALIGMYLLCKAI